MKKVLSAILMATLSLTNVTAATIDFDDDENPGGWNFELPGVKVNKSGSSTEVTFSLSSSFSFGFIGGINQAEGVIIVLTDCHLKVLRVLRKTLKAFFIYL